MAQNDKHPVSSPTSEEKQSPKKLKVLKQEKPCSTI